METVLKLKFTQHQHLKQMLLDTGDAELVEVCPCVIPRMFTGNLKKRTILFKKGFATGLVLGNRRGWNGE